MFSSIDLKVAKIMKSLIKKNKIHWLIFLALPVLMFFISASDPADSDHALLNLQNGNKRFVDNKRIFSHLDKERLKDTALNGQKPFAVVLTCSDSRVPAEHIFDCGFGDIFTVRVAGNVADTDEIGTIEYGIEHLHAPLVVIMGHTSCGAVTAVLKGDKVEGSIPELVQGIIPAAERTKKILKSSMTMR